MAIGDWNEADLERYMRRTLGEKFGIVPAHRITGELPQFVYTQRNVAPDAPGVGKVVVYAADSGGKLALFARFATGAPQQIAIEP